MQQNPKISATGESSALSEVASWYALAVLVVITLFGLVDRQIFLLMADPIKETFSLSDTQLGLLQGLGVALFSAIVAYPIGWLADRYNRKFVLFACVSVWSIAVVGCALASTFNELFIASAIVGAGEAGLVPIVFAMIPQIMKKSQRLLANSVYAVTTRLGTGVAIAFCGLLIVWVEDLRPYLPHTMQDMENWRLTFLAAATPAPFLLLFLLSIRTKARPELDQKSDTESPSHNSVSADEQNYTLITHLKQHKTTVLGFYIGMGMAAFGFASIGNWVPPIVSRMYDVPPDEAGTWIGTTMLVATIIGFALGVPLLKYLQPRFGRKLPIVAIWISVLIAAVTSSVLIFTTSATQIFVLQALQITFLMAALMIYPTALQDISPDHLRSRTIAINAIFMIVFGALSPLVVGSISDSLSHLDNGLLIAAVSASTIGLLLSALSLWWCSTTYEKTAIISIKE